MPIRGPAPAKNARIRSTRANSMMGPRVRAPENRGGGCVEGRAAFLGPRWDRLAYRGERRCREKIEKAWIGVAHPSQGGEGRRGGYDVNTSQGRQASPTCELLSVSGPEAITASTETFTAHIFSRARVATTSPSLRKPSRSATALRDRPQADVHAVWSSASSEPAATPTERCVVERAAVRTGKNS